MTTPVVFVVDVDRDRLQRLNVALAEAGYIAALCADPTGAPALIRRTQPDAVLLTVSPFQPEDSWQVIDQLRADPRTSPISLIVMNGVPQICDSLGTPDQRWRRCSTDQNLSEILALVALVRESAPNPAAAD